MTPMTPAILADKIERQLNLHAGLDTDFRLVMQPDAGRAFVELLRKTDELLEEVKQLKAERLELLAQVQGAPDALPR